MDINDNQQINTFTKGMNTDTSDMLLSTEQYRYAENVRLVTNTNSDTGELRIIDGNVVLTNFGNNKKLLYINSIQNYVVAIVETEFKNSSKDPAVKLQNPEWEIQLSNDCGETWKKIFGPCKELLHEKDKQANISGVLRWETDNDIKFYFVDDTGKHDIMYLNIADQNPVDEQFMNDIKGVIDYKSQYLYSPVVEISDSIGELLPARVQYVYRLYKLGGAATNLSPFSKILSLYKDDISGYNKTDISSNAVSIQIPGIEKRLHDRIQLYRITYNENGNLPIINLIYDDKVFEENFEYTDIGRNIYQISSEEFLSLQGLRITPKVIESKENYMYAANLRDSQDDLDEIFKDVDTVAWTSGMHVGKGPYYHDQYEQFKKGDMDYNKDYWKRTDGEIGGDGDVVSWNLVTQTEDISLNSKHDIRDQVATFKHGEVYRFGIIFYDDKGQKTSPKWIADIMIPNYGQTGFEEGTVNDGFLGSIPGVSHTDVSVSGNTIKYRYYSIKFSVNTSKLPKTCCAYEIVRCAHTVNDMISLTQGIVGRPYVEYNGGESTSNMYHSGYFTNMPSNVEYVLSDYKNSYFENYKYKSATDTLMFASPESVYQPDDLLQLFDRYKNNIIVRGSNLFFTNSVITRNNLSEINLSNYGTAKFQQPFEPNIYDFEYHFKDGGADGFSIEHNTTTAGNQRHNVFFQTMPSTYVDGPSELKLYNLSDIKHAESPNWDQFEENERVRFRDDTTVIGAYNFINWSALIPNTLADKQEYDFFKEGRYREGDGYGNSKFNKSYPISAGGDLFLLKFKDDVPVYETSLNISFRSNGFKFPMLVVDIIKKTIPYGGHSKTAINNSVFYSYGDVCKINESNNITVQSGDAHVGLFRYIAAHQWGGPNTWSTNRSMSGVHIVPIESYVDLRAQSGHLFDSSKKNSWLIQYQPSNVVATRTSDGIVYTYSYIQDVPAYVYNTAYGCQPTLVALGVNEIKDIYSPNFNTRIHYSEPKTNGEDIDNWLAYKPINYIDVDSRHGDITELRLFKEHLMFWQPDSTGIISSNERSIVQDTSGTDLVLGSGTVAQRYDYISTKYGMKYGQFNDTQSNTSLYWWDGNEKEILQYTSGSQVIPLSTTKNIKNYINKNKEVDRPNLFYNNKYKELVSYVVNNESVVYNEQVDAFTSIYKFEPKFNTSLVDYELISDDNKLELMDKNNDKNDVKLFNNPVYPLIQYVVNKNSTFVKTFDIQTFGGRFYGEDEFKDIKFEYNTPLKQHSSANGEDIVTTREYDFRLNIPRAEDENGNSAAYGDRMRGKTMQCEMSSISNSKDFSLQYITTKYRISWS